MTHTYKRISPSELFMRDRELRRPWQFPVKKINMHHERSFICAKTKDILNTKMVSRWRQNRHGNSLWCTHAVSAVCIIVSNLIHQSTKIHPIRELVPISTSYLYQLSRDRNTRRMYIQNELDNVEQNKNVNVKLSIVFICT